MRWKLLKLILLIIFLVSGFQVKSFAEEITSEVIGLKLENNVLFIEVAKRYPEIRFAKFQNPNKVLIELLDSKYHDKFKFDDDIKKTILNNTRFISDLTAGEARYDDNKTKVSIVLSLKEEFVPYPRVVSTKDNMVQISFEQPIVQNIKKEEVKIEVKPEELKIAEDLEMTRELYNNAVTENLSGSIEKAEELYKEIIAKDKNFYPARYNLSKLYFDKQDYDKSKELISSLILDVQSEEMPDKRILLLSKNFLGQIYLQQGDYDNATVQFNELIKIESAFYEAYYNLGIVSEKLKNIDQAILNFKKATELKSDYAPAYYHLGGLNLILKNKEEAISNLDKVISLVPESDLGKLSEQQLQKLDRKKTKKSK